MTITLRRSSWIVFALLLPVAGLHGQRAIEYSRDAESLFRRGLSLFEAARYGASAATFDSLITFYPTSHRISAAFIMKAKGLFLDNEPLSAARVARVFLSEYPASTYAADAEFLLGLIHVRLQRYQDAAQSFFEAWRKSLTIQDNQRLVGEIKAALDLLLDSELPVDAVRDMLKEEHSRAERALLLLKIGEKEAARGNVSVASQVADSLAAGFADAVDETRLSELRRRIGQRKSVKLGLLLPLMQGSVGSEGRNIGAEIYEGIQLALADHAERGARVEVMLEVRDTERHPLAALCAAQELTAQEDILAIIGPVFSNTTQAVAGLANSRGVPLITPTANSNGIAATGPYVFQANPDFETRGKAMAQFAVKARGYTTLAILAPADGHGKIMAEAFTGEVTRLGARLVAIEFYEREATDLQTQLGNIRRAGILERADPYLSFGEKLSRADMAKLVQLGVPMKRIDSLAERSSTIRATTLLGPRAKIKLDSLGIRTLYSTATSDSLGHPVLAIDAIYIPIRTPDELGVVSAQVVYYNFRTQLLGGGEWNEPSELATHRRYCSGVVFDSDSYVDEQSPRYKEVAAKYMERFKNRPTKYSLYGYDTADLVLRVIEAGGTSRNDLVKGLSATTAFQGLHSKISLSDGRVNRWLHFLEFTGEEVREISELEVQPSNH